MTISMTGFAAGRGQSGVYGWAWDIRSVNGKGFDLRLRLPEWVDGLEVPLRAAIGQGVARGNVSLTLKITREAAGEAALRVNTDVLGAVLAALGQVEAAAMAAGVTLAQASQADVLGLRGVLEQGAADEDTGPLRAALLTDLPGLLAAFNAMRGAEGAVLANVIGAQLEQVAALTARAAVEALVEISRRWVRPGAARGGTARDGVQNAATFSAKPGAGCGVCAQDWATGGKVSGVMTRLSAAKRRGVRPMVPKLAIQPSARSVSPVARRSGSTKSRAESAGRPRPRSAESAISSRAGPLNTCSSAAASTARASGSKQAEIGMPRTSMPIISARCMPAMRNLATPGAIRSIKKASARTPSMPRGSISVRNGGRPP